MSRRALVTSDSGGDGGAGVDDGGRGRWLLAMAVGSFVDAAGAVLAAAPPGVDDLMAGAVVSNAALVIDDGGLWISMAQGLGCWRCLLVMAGVGCWHARDGCRVGAACS